MPRLFIAIDLPLEVKRSLVLLQPTPCPDVKLTTPEQMHLTVHFLGETELEPVKQALQSTSVSPITLYLDQLGSFEGTKRDTILWIGVRLTDELRELHRSLAIALASTGYRAEARPYHPHITLARYKGRHDAIVEHFLQQKPMALPEIKVKEFHLYSSTLSHAGPIYQVVGTYSCLRNTFKSSPTA